MKRSHEMLNGMLVITAAAVVMTVPMLDARTVSASPPPPAVSETASVTTSPTPYTVRSGDSLAGIAGRYGIRLGALLQANSLTISSIIHPGDALTLPAGARTHPSNTTPAVTATSVDAAATTYIVKSGDALAGIAWKHGVKLGALVKANSLTTTSLIVPGQVLNIPPATMPIPAPANTASVRASTSPSTSGVVAPATGTASVPAANASIETVLTFLRAQVGVPYKFFSAGPDFYDCSGLVVAGWKQIGVTLPHQSQALSTKGAAVDWSTVPIQPGDLVFTSAYGDAARITHVGIALSDATWIHAVGIGQTVRIGAMPSDSKILAVRRLA